MILAALLDDSLVPWRSLFQIPTRGLGVAFASLRPMTTMNVGDNENYKVYWMEWTSAYDRFRFPVFRPGF